MHPLTPQFQAALQHLGYSLSEREEAIARDFFASGSKTTGTWFDRLEALMSELESIREASRDEGEECFADVLDKNITEFHHIISARRDEKPRCSACGDAASHGSDLCHQCQSEWDSK